MRINSLQYNIPGFKNGQYLLITPGIYFIIFFLTFLVIIPPESLLAERNSITIIDFSEAPAGGLPEDWRQVIPKKQKAYTNYIVERGSSGSYLKIRSGGTGSWIEKELGEIDVAKAPIMEWTWMVSVFPDVEWEQDRADDDFAIRIELVFDYRGSALNIFNIIRKGIFISIFKSYPPELTLSYVWARRVPAEKPYVSPSDKRIIVFPIESGTSMRGRWIDESRDIEKDLREFTKDKRIVLKKIRIRSDTDDSLSNAESGFGKLVLKQNG